LSFFATKGNFSSLTEALQSIQLTTVIYGSGTITATVYNGIMTTASSTLPQKLNPNPVTFLPTSYSVTIEIPFTAGAGASGSGKLFNIPQWSQYCIWAGAGLIFILVVFFCGRWCIRCCLCCEFLHVAKKVEQEVYAEGYETAATERL